jgi:hypothetical protein
LGFDEISFKQTKEIATRYTVGVVSAGATDHNSNSNYDSNSNDNSDNKRVGMTKDFVSTAFQAFNKFTDMSARESEIRDLEGKRTDVQLNYTIYYVCK